MRVALSLSLNLRDSPIGIPFGVLCYKKLSRVPSTSSTLCQRVSPLKSDSGIFSFGVWKFLFQISPASIIRYLLFYYFTILYHILLFSFSLLVLNY